MPAIYPGFLGPTYQSRSKNVDAERMINWYPQIEDGGGTPKVRISAYPCPGIAAKWLLGTGPTRGLFYQDGRCFAVSGTGFYELFPSHTAILRGTVQQDSNPVTIQSNGEAGLQLFVVAGGKGYIYNLSTNALNVITAPAFPLPCVMGAYIDGYFLALLKNSTQFNISALNDGTSWDSLDFFRASESSDNKIALVALQREAWLFGTQKTEVWYDSGDATTPFQPVPGVFIEHGIRAPFTAKVLDNSIFWLGTDETGSGVVWRNQGFTPVRVSTHAIEWFLNQSPNLDQAVAYAYQDEGHAFYVLYVPDVDVPWPTTYVYDVASQLWHERGDWNADLMAFEPHRGWVHCYAWGRHLVGDRTTGAVYEMRLDQYEDAVVA